MASPRFDCPNAFGSMGRYVCGSAGFAILGRTLAGHTGTGVRQAEYGDGEEVGAAPRRGQTRVLDDNPRTAAMHDCEATAKCSRTEGTEDR
jgi:hypothetical protein